MTYNAGIPLATDLISNSQAQLLANFSQLNTQFAVDHVAFNTGSGNGDGTHKKITFDNAPAEPSPAGTVSNVFPLLVGSAQELFFKNASTEYNGAGKVQLTGPLLSTNAGYVTIQGGLIVQWALVQILVSTGTFTYPKPYSSFFAILGIAGQQNTTWYVSAASLTALTITRSGSGASSCWAAVIGI